MQLETTDRGDERRSFNDDGREGGFLKVIDQRLSVGIVRVPQEVRLKSDKNSLESE